MSADMDAIAKAVKSTPYVLMLMRHGKTEGFSKNGDAGRELTDKGRKQAKAMAKTLEGLGLVPDVIASSAAKRARQTTDRMLKVFGDGPDARYHMDLYDGGMQALLDELVHTKPTDHTLLIVCHEPTVSIAAQWLSDSSVQGEGAKALSEMSLGFSPASIAVLGGTEPFAQWSLHHAQPLAFLRPGNVE
ncbi:MAG: phosphoglycerate mutase family protein [Bifidobacteriaceae bacterium]|nr:phosphoglycerate mutase family protein [Bifidobacteriaceae bacterium]